MFSGKLRIRETHSDVADICEIRINEDGVRPVRRQRLCWIVKARGPEVVVDGAKCRAVWIQECNSHSENAVVRGVKCDLLAVRSTESQSGILP